MHLLYKKAKDSGNLVYTRGNRTPHMNEVKKMKKFEDLMSIKNEIENISASEAKKS